MTPSDDLGVAPRAVGNAPLPLRRRARQGAYPSRWGRLVVPPILALGILLGWTVLTFAAADTVYPSPVWAFANAIGWSALPLAYPFIVLMPFVVPFIQELQHRWIFYTRLRVSMRRYLLTQAATNAAFAFVTFFVFAFTVFLMTFVALPTWGTEFDPDSVAGVTDEQFSRLTQLLTVHPALYGVAYSVWHGLNAAVWATAGLVLVLVVRNRVLALATPFLIFLFLAVLMSLAGPPMAWNTPWLLWILFSVGQVPFWPSIVTIVSFAGVAVVGLCAVVIGAKHVDAVS